MLEKKIVRESLKTLGRTTVRKRGWKEVRPWQEHAPAEYRRDRVRMARKKENQFLRNAFANGKLDDYEPLHIAQRDVDWFYF